MSQPNKFEAVLFDLDGTILNSKPLIRQSFLHAWEKVVTTLPPVERFMPLVGIPLKTMFEDVYLAESGREDPAIVERLLFEYREYMHNNEHAVLTLFDGCKQVLETLHKRGVRLAIVTSKLRGIALRHLGLCGVLPLLSAVVGEEDTIEHKPDPAPFLEAARRVGIEPQRCLACGDSPADLFSSHAAGMTFVAAVWGAEPPDALLRANPDHALMTPLDILTLFGPQR